MRWRAYVCVHCTQTGAYTHAHVLQDRDNDFAWYKLHFVGKPHWNFFGRAVASVGGGPMAVSVIKTGDFYTALVRTVKGERKWR